MPRPPDNQIYGFTALSSAFYRLACECAQQADEKKLTPFIAYPMGAVVNAACALEAFMNEELEVLRSMQEKKWKLVVDTLMDQSRLSLEDKYLLFAQLRLGKTFDKSAEPFQSFSLLIALRNALVHYQPEFAPIESFPCRKIQRLESKFRFTSNEHGAKMSWDDQVLNAECAYWACWTARKMIVCYEDLHSASGQGHAKAAVDTWAEPSREPLQGRGDP
jgi:hypothetical protein